MNLVEQDNRWLALERDAKMYAPVVMMARHFTNRRDMMNALGYDQSACNHWLNNKARPSRATVEKAAAFLELARARDADADKAVDGTFDDVAPTPPVDDLLLVVCPPERADKIKRVLSMLQCEFETVA